MCVRACVRACVCACACVRVCVCVCVIHTGKHTGCCCVQWRGRRTTCSDYLERVLTSGQRTMRAKEPSVRNAAQPTQQVARTLQTCQTLRHSFTINHKNGVQLPTAMALCMSYSSNKIHFTAPIQTVHLAFLCKRNLPLWQPPLQKKKKSKHSRGCNGFPIQTGTSKQRLSLGGGFS